MPQPQVTPTAPSLPGITLSNSSTILSAESKLCVLLWGPSGYGKTQLAGGLDDITQKYGGKRTLYIPVEAGEGGGAATIRKRGVPMFVPRDYTDLHRVLGLLRNDKSIGGVVLDSASELAKVYVKNAALKYPARENIATRAAGIPTRSDYQTMGELTSQILRMLIAFSTHEDPAFRKHVIVTATDVTREEDERITFIGPDLPGRMGREVVQMFQQVLSLEIKPETVDGKRTSVRYLASASDGVRAMKDRYGILPEKIRIKRSETDSEGEDLLSVYEKYYLPEMQR